MARPEPVDPAVIREVSARYDPPILAAFAGMHSLLCQPRSDDPTREGTKPQTLASQGDAGNGGVE